MNKEGLLNKLEELKDTKDYSNYALMNEGYRTAIMDVIDLVENLTLSGVVFSEAELKAKLEEQLQETRQWLIGEDFEGLAERL